MRRLMPNKLKTPMHVYKSITGMDVVIFIITLVLSALIAFTSWPLILRVSIIVIALVICALLCTSFGLLKGRTFLKYAVLYIFVKKKHPQLHIKENIGIVCKDYMKYDNLVAGVIEIEGLDFLALDENADNDEQSQRIAVLAELFKEIKSGKIIKQEKAVDYTDSINKARERIDWLTNRLIDYLEDPAHREEEKYAIGLKNKISVLANQLSKLEEQQEFGNNKVDAFYLIIFGNHDTPENEYELDSKIDLAANILRQVGLGATRLKGKQIRAFLQNFYHDDIPAGEEALEKIEYVIPQIKEKATEYIYGENKEYSIVAIGKYKVYTDNAWGAELFSIPGTRVVFNFGEYKSKDIEREIDKTISELNTVACDGKQPERVRSESADRSAALEDVKNAWKYENDLLMNTQFYIIFKKEDRKKVMKVLVGNRHSVDRCAFHKYNSFVEAWPFIPLREVHRESICQMPASQIAAMWPFVDVSLRDQDGVYVGYGRTPVIFDLFKRTQTRKSSNAVVFGSLGAGKSYFLKILLMDLNCYGVKVYCFDPENEYAFLCRMLGGEVINVAGHGNGIINPLQVMPTLPPESDEDKTEMGEVSSHKQFLEDFFRVILPKMDDLCHEFLNNLVSELYINWGIYDGIDIISKKPNEFPTFDDLIKLCRKKEKEETHDIDKRCYHILSIFLQKFEKDGAYSRLWNGHTSFAIKDTNFVSFSFRELIGNNNTVIANGQMLLLVMFVNQEIIKNREQNLRAGRAEQKFLVLFDECHNFIDPSFPVALKFMTRMSKQCRKYYGSQITATQNINDLMASAPEIRSKTTALLNNANYSFIFNLSSDDLAKIKDIYSSANNPLKQSEVQFILKAVKGDVVFFVDQHTRIQMKVATYEGDEKYFLQEAEKVS